MYTPKYAKTVRMIIARKNPFNSEYKSDIANLINPHL